MQRVLSEAESTSRRGLSEAESNSSGRRTRTPRGTGRLAERRHRSRSSASLRAAREALLAVKGAVPPVPKNGSATPSGTKTPGAAERKGSSDRTPTAADGRVIRKTTSRIGMTATPETSSPESNDETPNRTTETSKPTLNLPDFAKHSRDMLPSPLTPGRSIADDSDDSYLSAVSESIRGPRSAEDSDGSWNRAVGKRIMDEVAKGPRPRAQGRQRVESSSTARVNRSGELPSPTPSEVTAVGSTRVV